MKIKFIISKNKQNAKPVSTDWGYIIGGAVSV